MPNRDLYKLDGIDQPQFKYGVEHVFPQFNALSIYNWSFVTHSAPSTNTLPSVNHRFCNASLDCTEPYTKYVILKHQM